MTGAVLAYVGLVAGLVLMLAARFLDRRMALRAALFLPLWLLYVGVLSFLGVVADPSQRPPGIVFVVVPAVLFIALALVRGRTGATIAAAVPAGVLIALQTFRVGVELILHDAYANGLAPRMLTYEGANFDILIGLSAPIVGWLLSRGRLGARWAIAWNVAALCMLANVVARSALTAPGPLQLLPAEVPNLVIGTFPTTFIAGFFAPLAVALHVLSIRNLRRTIRGEAAAAPGLIDASGLRVAK